MRQKIYICIVSVADVGFSGGGGAPTVTAAYRTSEAHYKSGLAKGICMQLS